MHQADPQTISLQTTRKLVLYVLFCMVELAVVMGGAAAALLMISHFDG